jgi:hypothetical protein
MERAEPIVYFASLPPGRHFITADSALLGPVGKRLRIQVTGSIARHSVNRINEEKFMYPNRSRALALAALFATLAAQQASALPSITYSPGQTGQTIVNGVWSMTSYTPLLIPANAPPGAATTTTYAAAFAAWKASPAGAGWNLVYGNMSGTFNVSTYIPTLTAGGFGDLETEFTYTAGAGDPPAINGPWGNNNAVWSQSVSTNDPLAGALPSNATPGVAGSVSYLDGTNGGGNPAPAYPFQYRTSFFYDDPSRQGVLGQTITWVGDAMLSTINDTTKTITVDADIQWGFQITGAAINGNPILANGSDLGNPLPGVVNAVPEPMPTATLGLGLVGLALARKRRK